MGGGLHDVFSCQRCNKLSISHCTKFCELKKKKSSYYIISGTETKEPQSGSFLS
jgi:transcription elongation factor Elf1